MSITRSVKTTLIHFKFFFLYKILIYILCINMWLTLIFEYSNMIHLQPYHEFVEIAIVLFFKKIGIEKGVHTNERSIIKLQWVAKRIGIC